MKIVKFNILPLLVGALAAGGGASAAPSEADYARTKQEANAAADKWRDEIKQSFQMYQKHEAYLKAMQESSEKLRLFLVGKPCRDGAHAKEIETYIHGRFHTLYGSVVADIKHGVDLNCRDNKLAVTFWITDFTPTPSLVAAEKRVAEGEKSRQEIETATRRILGNWATAVGPSLTDKSKKIEAIRVSATLASVDIKPQLRAISCIDTTSVQAAAMNNLAAATKALNDNFTGYRFDIFCDGKTLGLIYDFSALKRKGT